MNNNAKEAEKDIYILCLEDKKPNGDTLYFPVVEDFLGDPAICAGNNLREFIEEITPLRDNLEQNYGKNTIIVYTQFMNYIEFHAALDAVIDECLNNARKVIDEINKIHCKYNVEEIDYHNNVLEKMIEISPTHNLGFALSKNGELIYINETTP